MKNAIDLQRTIPAVAEALDSALSRDGYDACVTFLHADGRVEAEGLFHDEKYIVTFELDNLYGRFNVLGVKAA